MKRKIIYSIFLLIIIIRTVQSQGKSDSLYGNVKRINEKVVFLTKAENAQIINYDDYGHSGFMGPEETISKFHNIWYSSQGCYYLNYERYFDKKRRVVKDIWYGKKDNFINSYKYKYDEKERLKSAIDSSKYSVKTENHYYTDDNDENIIVENLDANSFSHTYKKIKDGKIILLKEYDKYGVIDEYRYQYNENRKLAYRVYKDPNSWRKVDEKTFSYGVYDSIITPYKDIINEYDSKNRLTKQQRFNLYDDEKYQNPVLTNETIYEYKNDNISSITKHYKEGNSNYSYYEWDNSNRLTKKYCCDQNISKAIMIEEYRYKNDKISVLNYSEETFEKGKKKKYHITFLYKFDNQNNWIEIIKNVNGKNLYKWIRDIEYY
ncbi:hypothetical protein GJU43_19290 [Flavobacterium sp. LC2016-23]|uniref:hypothetical protein n=1 Tax=Flavobacterium sp. LC2016-23 TaxID=2666330 RepID=UPI0012B1266A|nr:hypothetical protein [Flavobacterium sp. LC2016-23]MRX41436.1 hypothetical protein [Flavobacterium sp. LC2016-23]